MGRRRKPIEKIERAGGSIGKNEKILLLLLKSVKVKWWNSSVERRCVNNHPNS